MQDSCSRAWANNFGLACSPSTYYYYYFLLSIFLLIRSSHIWAWIVLWLSLFPLQTHPNKICSQMGLCSHGVRSGPGLLYFMDFVANSNTLIYLLFFAVWLKILPISLVWALRMWWMKHLMAMVRVHVLHVRWQLCGWITSWGRTRHMIGY